MADINVNNNYTDMKNLTPFKLCVLQNFPFIEADFDAVTNYQLLCKVVEYLNKVIANNNTQNNNISQLEHNFITLYEYVNNYFNNLDVQEEINKKIDDLITTGEFNSFLSGIYTPEMFGAKGDGVTDDTEAIQKALAFNNVNISKNYLITENLVLHSNLKVFGGGTITKKAEFNDSYLNHSIFSCTNSNNIDINNNVLSVDMSGIEKGSETNRKDLVEMRENVNRGENNTNRTKYEDKRLKRIERYYNWDYQASELLEEKYTTGELHPSDMRARQLIYNWNKYKVSSIQYKLFGLGYLNQPEALSIERDIFMIIFSFGIIGFLTVLLKPVLIWIKSTIKILRSFRKIELDTLYLYEGLSIFFCISIYAGYTFIYTNFSIFLVIITLLLRDSFRQYSDNSFNKYFEKIYPKGKKEFYSDLQKKLINNEKQFIVTANPETLMQSEKDEELKEALLDSNTIIVPDGIGIIKGATKLNYNIKETILGVDIVTKLLEFADQYNKKVFLFGAKKEVIEKMKQVLKEKYSGSTIVGAVDGYVDNKDEIFEQMQKVKPDIILVALGIPNQEKLIYKNLSKFDKGIFVGVGGSFDVISGCKKRAPKIFVRLKLEWLYRITVEPSRLNRFYQSNIKYLFKINNDVI